jgi:hypothetical protein
MAAFHDTSVHMKDARKAAHRRAKSPGTRLQQHRADMRRRGFRLVQLWVPDPNAPGFREAVRRTRAFLAAHPDDAWDAVAERLLDEAPGWSDK